MRENHKDGLDTCNGERYICLIKVLIESWFQDQGLGVDLMEGRAFSNLTEEIALKYAEWRKFLLAALQIWDEHFVVVSVVHSADQEHVENFKFELKMFSLQVSLVTHST